MSSLRPASGSLLANQPNSRTNAYDAGAFACVKLFGEELQTGTIFALRVGAISVFLTDVISTAQVAETQGICTQEASIEIGCG